MIQDTLLIFGPSGIGQSPLDRLIRKDAFRIDPYCLRPEGPRDRKKPEDEKDNYYAHSKLQGEVHRVLNKLGDSARCLSSKPAVEWFTRSRVTFFDVRGVWQCLFLDELYELPISIAKAEIYASAVPILFNEPEIRRLFGTISIVVLNPSDPLGSLTQLSDIKDRTKKNCEARGDKPESIPGRLSSLDDEAEAWASMLQLGGTEFERWPFPEHAYRGNFRQTLISARRRLVGKNPYLERFFITESDIL